MSIADTIPTTDLLKGEAYIWGCNNNWNFGAAKENPERLLRQVLRQSQFFADVDKAVYDDIVAGASYYGCVIRFETAVGEYEIFDDRTAEEYVRNYVDDLNHDLMFVVRKNMSDSLLQYISFDTELLIRDIYFSGDDESIIDYYGDGIDRVSIWGIDMDTHIGGGVKEYTVVNVRRTN